MQTGALRSALIDRVTLQKTTRPFPSTALVRRGSMSRRPRLT